jgi:signal peptidase I
MIATRVGPSGERAERPRRRALRTTARWASLGLLVVAVIGMVTLVAGTATGRLQVQTVPTGSMEPAIPKGSAIVVSPGPVTDVAVGDVIVFAAPETGVMTVHRVNAIEQGEDGPIFTTKGDANLGADPWRLVIEDDQVHRVRNVVPGLGNLLLNLSSPITRLVLAVMGAAAVLGFGLPHIWRNPPGIVVRPSATWERALARLHVPGLTGARFSDDGFGAPEPDGLPLAPSEPIPSDPSRPPSVGSPAAPGRFAPPAGFGLPSRRRRGAAATKTASAIVLVLVAVAAWAPTKAHAAYTATASASQSVGTLSVPTPVDVGCAWSSTSAITTGWTTPPGGEADTTDLLMASTPTATPAVVATAAAGVTTANASPSPVTTVRYLSTRAVRGTWSSPASPLMATNSCIGSVVAYAGSGTAGFSGDGGTATSARLRTPRQSAAAADGRVFIADTGNNRIRVVATDGTITTFAGGGSNILCTYSGPATGVSLNAPRGVAVDAAGTVYIADTGNNCIRKVDTAGNVSRVAGGGLTTSCSSATVTATALWLSNPSGLAVAPDGSLVVADTGRNCVRRITGTTATLVAGGGSTTSCTTASTPATVSLSGPQGVAVTSSGDVLVADTGRNCVRRVTGTATTLVAGGGSTTSCTTASTPATVSLSGPEAVAVATDGSIVVADTGRRCVRQVTATAVTQLAFTGANAGAGDNGPAIGAQVRTPSGVTVLADGDVLVSDRSTGSAASRVRRVVRG